MNGVRRGTHNLESIWSCTYKIPLQKPKTIRNHVKIKPSISTCTLSQGPSCPQRLLWTNPELVMHTLWDLCGNPTTSSVQWRMDILVACLSRIWYHVKLLCHWSSDDECNWIVELLCSVMEWIIHTEQDKFHWNHISISQYNYIINFINPISIQ